MAMAERPPNDQLHPFFRPRAKVDQEAESPCVTTTETTNADRPQSTVTIPTIFQQPPPIKGTVAASKQPTRRTASRKQSSPCSPQWPDLDIFEGGHIYQREPSAEELIELFVGYHEESHDTNAYSHSTSKQSRRKQPVPEQLSSAFFAHQRSLRSEQETEAKRRPRPDFADLKYPLLSRSRMLRLLDKLYPDGWRTDACLSLFEYLYPAPADEDALPTQDPRSFPWRDKYRPLTIDGLLGNSGNCTYLRDWLQEMKVSPIVAPLEAVQKSSHNVTGKMSTKAKSSNIPTELQDFIVEDEDGDGYSQKEIFDIMNVSIQDIDENDQDFMPSTIKTNKRRKQTSSQTKKMEGKARSNLILLVGCHGVGKTASVYTAANEVGYDVFEINAGQKRSAKDILAMVGEMAESHQVSFDHVDRSTFDPFASFTKVNPEEQAVTHIDSVKPTDEKLVSGDSGKRKRGRPKKGDSAPKVKKSKATSKASIGSGDITRHFLRMKVKSLSPPPETPTDSSVDTSSATEDVDIEGLPTATDIESNTTSTVPEHKANDDQQTTGSQVSNDLVDISSAEEVESLPPPPLAPEAPLNEARNPKQSLILLEEVDILYEEDKTFWSSVISLAHKSKRPIVMTCNDIGLVPYDLLALQTTLYFELPSIEATTQYLQLVCIAEGYLIDPCELYYLCIIFGQDLRKLLNSLELWSRKQAFPGSDKMSLGVYPFLIDQIIGRDETFHDEIATVLAERRAITTNHGESGNLSLETMAKAADAQSYIDAFLKDSKADQLRRNRGKTSKDFFL
ncbi:hypothetical protein K450DRAFT_244945 [Umbelopsis ramanniana AG]|uniref:ATPase AAA-type core domain-containing protein n=1 Tax=Umbelopsis ramanniana AG TaxID=1314678 RepID=A0AAD5HC61_UMBRA|nr:uncharacterized protein K450DRAFT_244945 [Umbelopsis ramanniana AG]KAI8578880.1 hypothetical protein K450DRAFT_244945 [Umbelopsis ramanniana AG]